MVLCGANTKTISVGDEQMETHPRGRVDCGDAQLTSVKWWWGSEESPRVP